MADENRPRAAPEISRTSPDGPLTRADGTVRDLVALRLPAVATYVAVLRTTTASLAARLDFTLDEIEDLRIAVDEACAMLLAGAGELDATFEMLGDAIQVTISTRGKVRGPDRDSFAWMVLSALAGRVDTWEDADGRRYVALVKRREHGGLP